MRTLRVVILSAAVMLLLIQLSVAKNGNIGIYGIVDKVVFEPDGSSPERPQIWGLFVVPVPISSGLYKAPQRGVLYWLANPSDPQGNPHTSLVVHVHKNGPLGLPDAYPLGIGVLRTDGGHTPGDYERQIITQLKESRTQP